MINILSFPASCHMKIQFNHCVPDIVLGYSEEQNRQSLPSTSLLGHTTHGKSSTETEKRRLTNPGFLGNTVFVSWSWTEEELGLNILGRGNCIHKV